MKLLTTANTKILKSLDQGFMTFGIHLAPWKQAGVGNVCPSASPGCIAACLNTAGRGRMDPVQKSRVAKTQFFYQDRPAFMEQLIKEMAAGIRKAHRAGMKPVFRPNLTSDVQWEKSTCAHKGKTIFEHFPEVQFMDYTKIYKRLGNTPDRYHLTFSRSEENGDQAANALANGHNVAAVFNTPDNALPAIHEAYSVIDGDTHDLRFLDPKNVIVGLIAKGDAKKDKTGFVIRTGETK